MKNPLFISLILSASAFGWSPTEEQPEMPLDSFVLPEGLEITPWATSPMLYNPTNMDVDLLGRIWVTEGVNYRSKGGGAPKVTGSSSSKTPTRTARRTSRLSSGRTPSWSHRWG